MIDPHLFKFDETFSERSSYFMAPNPLDYNSIVQIDGIIYKNKWARVPARGPGGPSTGKLATSLSGRTTSAMSRLDSHT
jgi:hypothetical protein